MIGHVAERCGTDLVEQKLNPALVMSKASFKKTAQGHWRFHALDEAGIERVVDTESLSRLLFARGSGRIGTWTEMSKLWGKCWAAAIADLFQAESAIAAQVEWTVPQLLGFVFPRAKAIVFQDGASSDGLAGALKAILVMYAVNLPVVADRTIAAAATRSTFPRWSQQWCLDMIHDLVLTSGVSIWPGRYDYTRSAVETAFGVKLPHDHNELARRDWSTGPAEPVEVSSETHDSTQDETGTSTPEVPVPASIEKFKTSSGRVLDVLKLVIDFIARIFFRKTS
jgi:hypothetical protein